MQARRPATTLPVLSRWPRILAAGRARLAIDRAQCTVSHAVPAASWDGGLIKGKTPTGCCQVTFGLRRRLRLLTASKGAVRDPEIAAASGRVGQELQCPTERSSALFQANGASTLKQKSGRVLIPTLRLGLMTHTRASDVTDGLDSTLSR